MSSIDRKQQESLLETAQNVANLLKSCVPETSLRIRLPHKAVEVETDGWRAVIGDLGKGAPSLDVWLDRFTGYPQRKFYAGFRSTDSKQISSLARRAGNKLGPVRTVGPDEVADDGGLKLISRLTRSEFAVPIHESYETNSYYGFFDPTRAVSQKINPHFCKRAAAFFEDVARSLEPPPVADGQREVYPRIENRRKVTSHLVRERSKLLPLECKLRDAYECQVCGLRFEDAYGELGIDFAEAHHIVPLSKLDESVETRLKDLITVCANCHRMLHRMEGKRGDIAKLKTIVRKRA